MSKASKQVVKGLQFRDNAGTPDAIGDLSGALSASDNGLLYHYNNLMRMWLNGAQTDIVGTTLTQTLTNKTLTSPIITTPTLTIKDNAFTLEANADVTKTSVFDLSGQTTGVSTTFATTSSTNKIIIFPDATDTLVGKATSDTLTNKTLTFPIINVKASQLSIKDASDTTKIVQFDVSGVTTGTTRTLTIQDSSDTLVGRATTDTLTNKTLTFPVINVKANQLSIKDQTDTTKIAQFDASAITTGTTRTYTLPNASDTLVGLAVSQTLSNKTFIAPVLGAATATSINKLTITQPSSSATLTIADGKTLTVSNILTFTGTDSSSVAFGTGGTAQMKDTLSAKGDLYVATAATTVTRQGVGSDGQVLTADSVQTNGLKWSTPNSALDEFYQLNNLALSVTASGGIMTIAVKGKDGNDPSASNVVNVGFRNVTATNGTYNQRSITAALSMTLAGAATLGSLGASNIYVYLFDNAGTLTLGASLLAFDQSVLTSSSTTTTSNTVIYQASALSSKPIRLIGRFVAVNSASSWASPTDIDLNTFPNPTIFASYRTSATGTVSTTQTLNFDTKISDNYNMVTASAAGTGSWSAKALMAGFYIIGGNLNIGSTSSTGISLYKNGSLSTKSCGAFHGDSSQATDFLIGVSLASGDTIDIRTGGSLTWAGGAATADGCNIYIAYIGS